jgi:hypothetical protein
MACHYDSCCGDLPKRTSELVTVRHSNYVFLLNIFAVFEQEVPNV